jgi:hypothetical protein
MMNTSDVKSEKNRDQDGLMNFDAQLDGTKTEYTTRKKIIAEEKNKNLPLDPSTRCTSLRTQGNS